MKRIKYLGVLLSIVTLCVACEKSEKDGLGGFHKNFVELYVDGQIMLTEFQNECSGDAHRLSKKQIAGFVICIPSPKMYFFYGPDIEKFNRWAARNNDIDFNQVLANGALPMVATFADNFSKMVVTSNADWDEAHPAGTSLDDVLQVRINSSSDFVHDGYDMGEYKYEFLQNYDYLKTIEKRPSELTAADMKMVYYSLTDFSSQTKSPVIVFTSAPTLEKEHTLTLRWTTVEGDVKTASVTLPAQSVPYPVLLPEEWFWGIHPVHNRSCNHPVLLCLRGS